MLRREPVLYRQDANEFKVSNQFDSHARSLGWRVSDAEIDLVRTGPVKYFSGRQCVQ